MNYPAKEAHEASSMEERKAIENKFSAWRAEYSRFLGYDKSINIVDIGCGDGGFVMFLESDGYKNSEGVDISREHIAAARRLDIKNIHHGDGISFLRHKLNHYNVVFLLDVLNELSKEEARELLRSVHDSLKSGGICVIKSVNAESPMSGRIQYGEFSRGLHVTEHSIKNLLASVGFKEQKVYPLRPVIHGLVSLVRHILWRLIEGFLKLYRLIETGSKKGVFTQSLIALGRK